MQTAPEAPTLNLGRGLFSRFMEFIPHCILIPACAKHFRAISSQSKPTTMKPEMILQAHVLDIIFDNRNKEYGAYELRSHYERRLKKSLAVVFVFISFLILFYYWLNNISHNRIIGKIFPQTDSVLLTPVDLGKNIIQPEIHPAPHHPIATIQNSKYLIVPNKAVTHPPPTLDQLDINKIGVKTQSGDLGVDIVQPPLEGTGKSNSTETQLGMEKDVVVDRPDFMPEFPGGMEALQRFLSRNLRMPRQDLEPGSKISTLVRFVVDKNGTVADIELEKRGGKEFDNEVERVVKKMPQWKPGIQHGKYVAVFFRLPVIFQVPDEN
jgi:protein TonB